MKIWCVMKKRKEGNRQIRTICGVVGEDDTKKIGVTMTNVIMI